MTQEEKQLLLKDLCSRLPYGVKCRFETTVDTYETIELSREGTNGLLVDFDELYCYWFNEGFVLPYLRPMSSMTESEIDKLFDILHIDKDGKDDDWIKINDVVGIKFFFPTGKWVENVAEAYDYLNSIHIDYRGLIDKGLALEAPEGMYKTE